VASIGAENGLDDIRMRIVNSEDESKLLGWRNSSKIVKYTRTQSPISTQEHSHWFKKRLEVSELEPILIFMHGEASVGMTRLDLIRSLPKTYEVSILVDEGFQNAGLGTRMLFQTCSHAAKKLSATFVTADIHNDNYASIKLFTNLGFIKQIGESGNFSSYELDTSSLTPINS